MFTIPFIISSQANKEEIWPEDLITFDITRYLKK